MEDNAVKEEVAEEVAEEEGDAVNEGVKEEDEECEDEKDVEEVKDEVKEEDDTYAEVVEDGYEVGPVATTQHADSDDENVFFIDTGGDVKDGM